MNPINLRPVENLFFMVRAGVVEAVMFQSMDEL